MEVNFDILISGCNTRCMHCYVNGGPAGIMPLETALLTIEKLDAVAELLPFEAGFTLDNEPMNHPDVETVIRSAAASKHIKHFHHGMTSGIALIHRKDRADIMRAYMDCGYSNFGITIHGNESHHDEIVRRRGSYKDSVEAFEFMKGCGAETEVSLMLNRFFDEDADGIDTLLTRLQPDCVYFAVPNFTPHGNMIDFEPYRASTDTLTKIRPLLSRWGQQEEELRNGTCTIGMLREQLEEGLDIAGLFECPQDELYMTVHQNGDLFVGNTGVETECLGNMLTLDIKETAERICGLPGNRDYGALYEIDRLPGRDELIDSLSKLPQELLYSDRASVIYRGLAEMGVPTRILKAPRA